MLDDDDLDPCGMNGTKVMVRPTPVAVTLNQAPSYPPVMFRAAPVPRNDTTMIIAVLAGVTMLAFGAAVAILAVILVHGS
jgi:hypothetical protein